MRLLVSWILAVVGCGSASASPLDPGIEPRAILRAIRSDDPRAVAWGAWRAMHVLDSSIHEETGKALLRLDPGNEAHTEAILAVFHSIIHLRLALPADTLYRYFDRYPGPTLIALTQGKIDAGILPLLSSKTADEVYWTATAEIACLAQVPGIAKILLDEYIANGQITVTDDYSGQMYSGAGAPILGPIWETSRSDAGTWPPLFVYSLAVTGEPGDTLLLKRPIPMYVRRLPEGVHRGGGMPIDLRKVRHKLLREMVATLSERIMVYEDGYRYQDISSCPATLNMSFAWGGAASFVQRFTNLHQDRRKWCDLLIADLRKRGALTPVESVTIPIQWWVHDTRSNRSEPLPDLSGVADVKYLGGKGAK